MSDQNQNDAEAGDLLPTDDMEELFDEPAEAADPGDELAIALQELNEYRDRYQRALADQENARKRHQREMQDSRRYGISELAKDLLEVADNLDRALDGTTGEAAGHPVVAGVRMVRDELHRALKNHGVETIDSVGQPFDPMFHNAIMQDERADMEPGTVTEELAKGYRIGDRLLRASMVKVAKRPAGAGGPDTGEAIG